MEYRLLGRSGLKVSTITMGTLTFGAPKDAPFGSTGLADAKRQIAACLDAGVNMLDTADVYSTGASETVIGQALGRKRGDVLIATKARFPMGPGPNDRGSSRHHLVAACEASLRRLKTDWIDLYQLHEWDGQTPLEETLAALDHLVSSGKVRYVGCSNFSGWHVMKALAVSDRMHYPRFVAQQIHYTLHSREAEYELVPISVSEGLGILVWSPIAGGFLSGKFRRNRKDPKVSRHLAGWKEPPIRDEEALYDLIDVLVEVADARGVSGAQVALAWLIGRPGVTSVIVGGRTMAQFKDNLGAADLVLTDEERSKLDKASQPPLLYPYWHQVMTAKDRLSAADLAFLAPYV
ncbi:MAG: aldo/keto reductase [Rhizobiales bacterium]|nr:aldo/keto reductase [Hyphomicrobiales bacterium]